MFNTLSEVKAANKKIGNYWFSKGAMSFFNSKVESTLYKNQCFITSEQYNSESERRYSVRVALSDGSIDTISEFQEFRTKDAAREFIKTVKDI